MIKPKMKKILPVLLSVSMMFSMSSPFMAVTSQASEPGEQNEKTSDNFGEGGRRN